MKSIKDRLVSRWMKTQKPYPELAKLVKSYNSFWKAPEILYLGDSVVERISMNDKDKRTLDRMVANYLAGKKRLLCISHSAYHLKIYYYLLYILKCTRQKPKLVILPINMRSFSPQWDMNSAWQFEEEIDVLKKYIESSGSKMTLLKKSSDYFIWSEDEKMVEVKYPFTSLSRIGQFHDLIKTNPSTDNEKSYRKKQIYIFHYLYPLTSVHPKLLFLNRIMELLCDLSIATLVYITPINYQGGERYVGDGFIDLFCANESVVRNSIASFLEKDSVHYLDLGKLLSSDYFFHADEATEHLNQYGRMKLAETIASEVLNMDLKMQGVPSL